MELKRGGAKTPAPFSVSTLCTEVFQPTAEQKHQGCSISACRALRILMPEHALFLMLSRKDAVMRET